MFHTQTNPRIEEAAMTLASHDYRGVSIGSEVTCHQLPGYDLVLDMGQATPSSTVVPNVFITHAHGDHIGGVKNHFMRRESWGLPRGRYYMQEEDVRPFQDVLRAEARLCRNPILQEMDVVGLTETSRITIKGNLELRPFWSAHRIPTLGAALFRSRKRLKPEFEGKSGKDLVAAKKAGIQIDELVDLPEVCYPGDTNLNVLTGAAGETVRKSRLLLLECTFIDDEVAPKQATRTGHVHVEDFLKALWDGAFGNEVILLTHFSARYTPDYIRNTLDRRLKDYRHQVNGPQIKYLLP